METAGGGELVLVGSPFPLECSWGRNCPKDPKRNARTAELWDRPSQQAGRRIRGGRFLVYEEGRVTEDQSGRRWWRPKADVNGGAVAEQFGRLKRGPPGSHCRRINRPSQSAASSNGRLDVISRCSPWRSTGYRADRVALVHFHCLPWQCSRPHWPVRMTKSHPSPCQRAGVVLAARRVVKAWAASLAFSAARLPREEPSKAPDYRIRLAPRHATSRPFLCTVASRHRSSATAHHTPALPPHSRPGSWLPNRAASTASFPDTGHWLVIRCVTFRLPASSQHHQSLHFCPLFRFQHRTCQAMRVGNCMLVSVGL